jgi:DeoR/GlpR family transcriptional regulator of sugar metabolism
MLTEHRKKLLLDRLATDRQLVAKTLSIELELSEDTIRRDLRELAAEGKLLRVHGGAIPASPTVSGYSVRTNLSNAEKKQLAIAALPLLHSDMTCFIDGGTTNEALVAAFPEGFQATVVTHSPIIACALLRCPNVNCIVVGGVLFRHSMVMLGTSASEAIAGMRFDTFFLGATALDCENGLTTGNYDEAEIKRAIARRSGAVVCLMTADKINAASPFSILPLEKLSTLVVSQNVKLPNTPEILDIVWA